MTETKSKSRSKKGAKDAHENEATHVAATKSQLASKQKVETKMSDVKSIVEFSEDVSTAEAPPPLPVGDYPAEIRAAEVRTSATSGRNYGSVTFFIAPESYPADFTDGNPDGAILSFNRVSVSDDPVGRHRLRKFIESIGAKGGTKIDMNDWVGLTAIVSIVHDEYEGETRAAIAKVTAA